MHIAVDILGHLLALKVTAADQGDREQVSALAQEIQDVTGSTVELAYVDQGYTGPNAAEAASEHGIQLEMVKHPLAKCGFVLLPRRWIVSEALPGPPASAGSPETTNGSTQHSKDFTISPSPSS